MKYIIGTLKALGLGFIVAGWLFTFGLAYDAHIKQVGIAAWIGGLQSCKKQSSHTTQQREGDTWETSEYLSYQTHTLHSNIPTR